MQHFKATLADFQGSFCYVGHLRYTGSHCAVVGSTSNYWKCKKVGYKTCRILTSLGRCVDAEYLACIASIHKISGTLHCQCQQKVIHAYRMCDVRPVSFSHTMVPSDVLRNPEFLLYLYPHIYEAMFYEYPCKSSSVLDRDMLKCNLFRCQVKYMHYCNMHCRVAND